MNDDSGPRPPELRPRILGPEGSLAGDFVRGRGRARSLLERYGPAPGPRRARIGSEAFRVTGSECRGRLESILSGSGRLVVTGQQPVLFGGPLYVLYKVLSAVAAAERLEEETGEPALALFWVGSDDHDWEEAGGIRLLDPSNELREIRLDPPQEHRERSAGPAPLPVAVERCADEIEQILPQSDFIDSYLELIRDTHRPGRPLGEAFSELLCRLVAPRPLAVLDASEPRVKEEAAPFLDESLERAAEEAAAVGRASEAVREAGYDLQMPLLDGASHVFVDTGERRVRVYLDGDTARLGREGREVALGDLRASLREEPGRFSPNVALRPVLESWLLPVSRAVLGPGELAYWAQLPGLFELHGVPMPDVEPRGSWAVIEEKVAKVLRRFEAEPDDFRDGGAGLRDRVVSDARPAEVGESLGDLRSSIGRALQEVEGAVGEELPGIRASVGKARSRLFEAVDELEHAVDHRVEERQAALLAQLDKAAVHLYPDGKPQERVLNPLYYLARYDGAFVEAADGAARAPSGSEGEGEEFSGAAGEGPGT